MRHSEHRRNHRDRHTDDWLMTYADMITLLLCLFVVFLSITVSKKEIVQKVTAPPPVEQVKIPEILEGNLPFHGVATRDEPTDGPIDDIPAKATDNPPALPSTIQQTVTTDEPPAATVPVMSVPTLMQSMPLPETPSISLPEIVNRLKTEGGANLEQKGDRITTLEINSTAFFTSGSSTLSTSGKAILRDVAVNLKSDKFKDYQVTVEGHTDDTPINTLQFPSNWELSTARAAAVVHFFIDQGIPAKKLRAAGYADTFPIAPNRDEAGHALPDNQAKNRRVVMKLEKIEKTE